MIKKGDVLTCPDGVDASNTILFLSRLVWPNEFISTPWEADGPDIWKDTKSSTTLHLCLLHLVLTGTVKTS